MSDVEATKSILAKPYIRYSIAVVAVAASVLMRLALEQSFGKDFPKFIIFYPAVMVAAIVAGLGPGLLATALASLAVDYWVLPPRGSLAIASTPDAVALAIFFGMGVFISLVAEANRRNQQQIAAYKRELALQESRQTLQHLSEYHRLALEAAELGVWDSHFETGEFLWDERCRNRFGVAAGDRIEYDAIIALIHPKDRAAVDEAVKRAIAGVDGGAYHQEYRVVWSDGSIRWVSSHGRAYFDGEGAKRRAVRFVGVNMETTARKQSEVQLQKLNRTLKALSNSNHALLHATCESELLQQVCTIVREDCGHAMVWIGIAENDEDKSVRPVAHAGFEEGYLETLQITWSDSKRGRGPTGTAIRTGRMSTCRNMLIDPVFLPWREEAIQRGYAASLVVPLLEGDKPFGAITIYSREPDAFAEGEVDLLMELAADLSYGIATLRLRAAHAQSEEALRSSQAKLQGIVGSAMDAVISVDEQQRIVVFNRAAETIFQCAASEALGSTLDRFIPEALREAHVEHIRRFGTRGATARSMSSPAILAALRSNGQEFPIEATISQVHADAEKLYTVILRDITERKRTEDALRESEERWATTLQSIGDAVISTDSAGNIQFMNDVAQRLTGWSLPEARGRDLSAVFDIVQEVTRIKPESPVAKVLRSGLVVGLANHTALIRRDGTEVPIEDSAAPIRNRSGQIEGVVLVFHDVVEQRNAEKALRVSDRLATTGRLAATIAHEIHNPLDAIGNLLYLIGEDTHEDNTREYVSMASRELVRVTQMTRRMLTFQREAANPVPVEIGEILRNVIELYERKIMSGDIHLTQKIEVEGHILALPGELRQMFANLVGNAIEAVALRKGKITLRACASRDWRSGRSGVRVVVADNGPGIPVDVRARIFEPFFTTKGESGTGLGLWIASDILRKYDGVIKVRTSTQPHCSGTCFSIFLPIEIGLDTAVRTTPRLSS
jgi:PAS domain S-box-containing protein